MPEQPPHPAEFPAEGEGGSGFFRRRPGGIGGPQEMPPYLKSAYSQLVREVFQLRNRLHSVENTVAAMRLGGGAQAYLPNEMPEGEGGGGGGGIHEIGPPEIHEIAEMPINRLVSELASLTSRFATFQNSVLKQLEVITQRLDAMKR